MKHSAHYSLSVRPQTLSLGTCPALWSAIENMNNGRESDNNRVRGNSRVFCFWNKEKMTDTKSKRQAEFVRQHTLTESDLRKMIAEKLERARAYHNAQLRREALLERR